MSEKEEKYYSIGEVESAVGLPRSTLRYYESVFPTFLKIEKTPGGHRRYNEYNIEQFKYLAEQIQKRGIDISTLRDKLTADNDPQRMRQDVDLVLKVTEELIKENKLLKASFTQLATRLRHIEEALSVKGKKKFLKWFE